MPSRPRLPLLLAAFAVFLVVLGTRWTLIARAGSPVPFQDQWYAEAEDLYLPAGAGGVPLAHFFQPHNDHRIVPTRVLAYALLRLNDQWDVRAQMLVNAGLAALLALPLLALLRPWFAGAPFVAAAALLAGFYSLPVLYENALWGFQSMFYFLVLFSLAHVCLVLARPAFSAGWWLGLVAGLAAVGTMGSGLLAPAAVALVAIGRAWREPASRRDLRPTLVATVLLVAFGAAWLPPRLGAGTPFDVAALCRTLAHAFDFPRRGPSFAGLLLWLPFAVFAATRAAARVASVPERLLLAAGGWVLLQIGAIAVVRPEVGPVLANRYGDILTVGLVANVAAAGWLWSALASGRHARLGRLALGAWAAAGLAFAGYHAVVDARLFREGVEPLIITLRDEQAGRIRRFYREGNPAALTEAAYPHIPVVDAPSLVRDLDFPAIRAIMPWELRDPIALAFPDSPGQPSLANAVPVSLPNEPGALHRGTWTPSNGAAATVTVTSRPARKHAGRALRFMVAGDLVAGETELRVHDASGATAAVITHLQSATLQPVIVDVPGEEFSVEVVDRSPTRWLAFLEPVEIGPVSRATLAALPHGRRIAQAGWLVLAGLLIAAVLPRRKVAAGV